MPLLGRKADDPFVYFFNFIVKYIMTSTHVLWAGPQRGGF